MILFLDNTNVTHSEVETYINLAKQYGYVVVLVEPKTPWKFEARQLAARNTHNVSFTKIRRKVEQYDEILPLYFGWFVSPADYTRLQTTAKDSLWKCLQITDFQQCIKAFSGDLTSQISI
jgi:2',3'-cyclic-nucleotide 3'-phosphodiesterase